MELKLNGPSAVLALGVIGVFTAYRLISMQAELETDALEELKMYLSSEYASPDVAALSQKLSSGELTDAEALDATARIMGASNIEFPSYDARGMWKGRDGGEVIVKVTIRVDGADPPDGEPIRYYRMRYRPLVGWKVGARTSALLYWLKLF